VLKKRRPQLDRLLADCRHRLADAVVYRYDRFVRSLRQLVRFWSGVNPITHQSSYNFRVRGHSGGTTSTQRVLLRQFVSSIRSETPWLPPDRYRISRSFG
jgi:hypothetical protein